MMTTAFVFPGQGSQAVGMSKSLAENFAAARAVFDEVDAALGQKLAALMWEGPEAELTLTENAQPALMAVSMAVIRVLEAEHGITVANTARFVAGHSLGEYSALAAAGTFTLADAARLLKTRGQAMQGATPVGTGAMTALLGLDFATASAAAAEAAQVVDLGLSDEFTISQPVVQVQVGRFGALDLTADPGRVLHEVAVFAEKTDVTEELARLEIHWAQAALFVRGEGADDEGVGRRFDFVCQEMNREANTIGSKVQDVQISSLVIEMKAELERLREQVQNVE